MSMAKIDSTVLSHIAVIGTPAQQRTNDIAAAAQWGCYPKLHSATCERIQTPIEEPLRSNDDIVLFALLY